MLSACALIPVLATSIPAGAHFLRGDSNHDQQIDLTDAIAILGFMFVNSPTSIVCEDASDVNDTAEVDIADAIYLLNHLFLGGPPPAAPYPIFEADPTEDELGCLGDPVDITGNITRDLSLTRDKLYCLRGVVSVKEGVTLSIEEGTTILGKNRSASEAGLLIIEAGAKIVAVGTETHPIVFTSPNPVGSRSKGDWGGIMLFGKAKMNVTGASCGINGCFYRGGDNNEDSSGRLSYVRIEYGGAALSPDNEVNGLWLYAVGRGTQLDHLQCRYIADDAVEWWGGAAQFKYAIGVSCTDDMYDTSFGTEGRGQFLIGLQNGDDVEASTFGFEMDNSEAPIGSFTTDRPISKPVFSNVTLCGPGTPKSATAPGGAGAMLIRRNTAGQIYNFILQGFRGYGVDIDDGITTDHIDTGALVVNHGIFYQNGLDTNPAGDGHCQVGEADRNAASDAWVIDQVHILDLDGNDATGWNAEITSGSSPEFSMYGGLCIEQPWCVRCEVVPRAQELLSPDEVWTIAGVDVGTPGGQTHSFTGKLRGHAVDAVIIALPEVRKLEIQTRIAGEFGPPFPRLRCSAQLEGGGELSPSADRSADFELPEGAKRVNFTLSLPRMRVVEFTARPTRPGAVSFLWEPASSPGLLSPAPGIT